MPTRDLLAPTQRAQFTAIPIQFTEREFIRYYTLSDADLAVIRRHRRPQNRLGFAVQLCYLRYPGRALSADEVVPVPLLAFIAAQLGCDPVVFGDYGRARDTTRREHLTEIRTVFGYHPFDRTIYRALSQWLQPVVQATDNGVAIITALVDELRARQVIAPALSTLERLGWEARRRAQQHLTTVLTGALTDPQRAQLDALLVKPADMPVTPLATQVAGHALTLEQGAAVYRETEGNPLFIVEMLRAASEQQHARALGSVAGQGLPGAAHLPSRVQAVIARRLARLSPLARELARVAATIGCAFTMSLLASACGDLQEDALVRGIDELWQRRIIREHTDGSYEFSHAKLREVAYHELSAARREQLQRRIAESRADRG
jgi:hypothetical protein